MNLNQLQPYLPTNASIYIEKWIETYPLTLKITKSRATKLGDYRKINSGRRHQITINGDLNPEAFFFVLTHEIAHMVVYAKYAHHEVNPHGKEWKNAFRQLLLDSYSIYPENLQPYILNHAKSPKASVGADRGIAKFVINDSKDNQDYLEDLELGAIFRISNKILQKGEKIKLRYICCEVKTQKKYLVNASALVEKL